MDVTYDCTGIIWKACIGVGFGSVNSTVGYAIVLEWCTAVSVKNAG